MFLAALTPFTWHALRSVEGLTAFGTLVLAVFTVGLAVFTARMANKTARLAEFTEKDVSIASTALAADVRPVLIAVPMGEFVREGGANYFTRIPGTATTRGHPDRGVVFVQDVEGRVFVSVPFWNEGAGIAFCRTTSLRFQVDEWHEGEISSRQVPLHGFTRASFYLAQGGGAPTINDFQAAGVTASVAMVYVDLAGNMWGSRLVIAPDAQNVNDWSVTGFDIWHEGGTESVTV